MAQVNINGVDIDYDDEGSGDPIVLVHGHPFDRSMWRPQLGMLVDSNRRVVAADLRGYGESEVRPGVTVLGDFADDQIALLDLLGIERSVLVGLSMGGQIVMDLAARFPDRVTAMVLADTLADAETYEGRQSRMETADQLIRDGMSGYTDDNVSKMVGPSTMTQRPDVVGHVRKMMLGAPPAGAAAALRGRALRRDYALALEALKIPVLIVVGSHDGFTTVADAERMHRSIADSELIVIEDAGHLPNLEQPDIFNAALTRFLDAKRLTK